MIRPHVIPLLSHKQNAYVKRLSHHLRTWLRSALDRRRSACPSAQQISLDIEPYIHLPPGAWWPAKSLADQPRDGRRIARRWADEDHSHPVASAQQPDGRQGLRLRLWRRLRMQLGAGEEDR